MDENHISMASSQDLEATSSGKILLVTKQLVHSPRGGREMLSKLNHDALALIFGDRLLVFELPANQISSVGKIISGLRSHIDGLTVQNIDAIISQVQTHKIESIFVDGSNLGALIYTLKRRLGHVHVTCFFHNVEARFFWGSFLNSKAPRALAVLISNFLAERKAVLFSDHRLCLSDRDSHLLKKLYGQGATHIHPMALKDKTLPSQPSATSASEPFALFVGSDFYANRQGITWFVRNVMPHVDLKLYIVGKGMEEIRSELQSCDRVEVVGTVERLDEWYANCLFVVAPIFDGSGMKTKVAEALMYGKKVVGTSEAFSGYERFSARSGWYCNSPSEFIAAINEACRTITSSFDPELRKLYEDHFSFPAATARLALILDAPLDS